MSILNVLAIVGVAVGAIALVGELRYKGKRSFGLIISLIVASALLFVFSQLAADRLVAESSALKLAVADGAPAAADVAADAKVAQDAPVPAVADGAPAATDVAADAEVAQDAPVPAVADGAPAAADVEVAQDAPVPDVADGAPTAADVAADDKVAQDAPVPGAAPAVVPPTPAVPNDPAAPRADAGSPVDDGKINEKIAFSAKKSKKNPKGSEIVAYTWDFGDGTSETGRDVKHAYTQVGTYEAQVRVVDADGRVAVASRMVAINRPESKIHFVSRALNNLDNVAKADDPVTGTITKTFTGSHIYIDASGYMLSTEGCRCEIVLSLQGAACAATKSKFVENGGEGNISVKAMCKAEPGEVTWKVERRTKGTCGCTWTGIKYDVSEG
ncbi:MAG: PKD domain-containing protein [Bradymonadia bacterium]